MRRATTVACRTPAAARTGGRPSPVAAEEPAAATAPPDLARTSRLGHRFATRPSALTPAPVPPVQPLGGEGSEEEEEEGRQDEARHDEARGERSAPRREGLPFGGTLPPLPPAAAFPPAAVPAGPPPALAPIRPENLDPVDRLRDAVGGEDAADRFLGQTLLAQRRAAGALAAIGDSGKTVAATADPFVPFTASSDQLRGRPGFYHPGPHTAARFRRIEGLARDVGHEFHGTPSQPVDWAKLHAEPTLLAQQRDPVARETLGGPLTPRQRLLPTGVSRALCTVSTGPGNCEGLYRADADAGDRTRAIGDPHRLHLYPPHQPPLHVRHNDLLVPRLPGPDDLLAGRPSAPRPVPAIPAGPAPPRPGPRRAGYLDATDLLASSLSSPRPERLEAARRLARHNLADPARRDIEGTFHEGLGLLTRTLREDRAFPPAPRLRPLEPPVSPAPVTPRLPFTLSRRQPPIPSFSPPTTPPSRDAGALAPRLRAPKRSLDEESAAKRWPEPKRPGRRDDEGAI